LVRQSFSIASARIHFPGLIHKAESGMPVEITRRGKPVAVVVSTMAYRRLAEPHRGFWDAVKALRGRTKSGKGGLRSVDLRGLRDTTPGRGFQW